MNIKFEYSEFLEEDQNSWYALFVKIDDGPWHMAQPAYNTEYEDLIREIILGN